MNRSVARPVRGAGPRQGRRLELIIIAVAFALIGSAAIATPGLPAGAQAANGTASAAAAHVLQLTDGEIQPGLSWSFSILSGPKALKGKLVATDSSFARDDGLLDFAGAELRADRAYWLCQTDVPAGWFSTWRIDTVVVPSNPDQGAKQPDDLGRRCLGIGAGSAFPLAAGGTLLVEVDNHAPGGDPRGAGFWNAWSSCASGTQYDLAQRNGGADAGWFVLDDLLAEPGVAWGDYNITDCDQGAAILGQRDAASGKKRDKDAAYRLASQLLAAQLNFAAGAATCAEAQDAAAQAEALLIDHAFDGSGSYLRHKRAPDRDAALALAEVLAGYNLGQLCPLVPPETGSVSGTVTDADTGTGLIGAIVSIDAGFWTAATDGDGHYMIEDVAFGERMLSASFEGYEPADMTIDVDGDVTWDAALAPVVVPPQASTVVGTISDVATGSGLAGALVSIDDGAWTTVTDIDGSYEIADVDDGERTIGASADGYQGVTESITVDGPTIWDAALVAEVTEPPTGGEPGPAPVPSEIDQTVLEPFASSVAFLYEGPNAVQHGVAAGAVDERRVSVISGAVTSRDGTPLAGTLITVLQHAELGHVTTRADGRFDIAVNGGGAVTVVAELDGFLTAQRSTTIPWNDYLLLEPIRLVPLSPVVTPVDLTSSDASVARGEVETDTDGSRQGTLIFQPGTTAEMELPNGSRQALTELNVRITEFTVGANGPQAMPARLPPTSGYTYAAEYSADEADAAGAVSVHFDPPAVSYTEDFVGFPVGTSVPTGAYDRVDGAWKPSGDGIVLEIVAVNGGLAEVDLDGDGVADDASALGMTDAERAQLGAIYAAGTRLWRVPVPHFSPWDHNWPFGPPPGARGPRPGDGPSGGGPRPDDPCARSGSSTIECQTQILREDLDLAGTAQGLHYRSDRADGYLADRTLHVVIPSDEIPDIATKVVITLDVAGTQDVREFPAWEDVDATFLWDGHDAFGRQVFGPHPYSMKIAFVYEAFYAQASGGGGGGGGGGGSSFALQPGELIEGSRARQEIILSRTYVGELEAPPPPLAGIGGWTLSDHHGLEVATGTLYEGTGEVRRSGEGIRSHATDQISSNCPCVQPTEGGDVSRTLLSTITDVIALPDGSMLVALAAHHEVWRITPDGTLARFAGTGAEGNSGDGGPAIAAQLANPNRLALLPDGSVLITQRGNPGAPLGSRYWVVRRVAADGTISTALGGGAIDYSDNLDFVGPATSLYIGSLLDVAAGTDGSFYAIQREEQGGTITVWQIAPDGTAQRIGGSGTGFSSRGDGGPALDAQINAIRLIALANGDVIFAEGFGHRVRRISGGVITTIAGTGSCTGLVDGGPATTTSLCGPEEVLEASDGSLLISTGNERIFRLDGGEFRLYAGGGGSFDFYKQGAFALGIRLGDIWALDWHPDGSLLYSALTSLRRLTRPALFGTHLQQLTLVPSADGRRGYLFDGSGRHVETVDLLTGFTVRTFDYDADGRLTGITDAAGMTTSIERDGAGTPTAIVGPYGRRTGVTVSNGRLTTLTGPDGGSWAFTYGAGGALASATDPRGSTSTYGYNGVGRLVQATSRAGGVTTLQRTSLGIDGYEVALTTRGNETTTHRVEVDGTGLVRTVIDPSGATTTVRLGADGSVTGEFPDGTVASYALGPDPRFGPGITHVASSTWTSPGGVSTSTTVSTTAELEFDTDPTSLQTWTENLTQDGRTTTTVYEVATRTLTRTSPEGRLSTFVLDEAGRLTSERSAQESDAVTYGYDTDGRLVSMAQGDETITFAYDANGDVVGATDDDGGTWAWTYDPAGRTTSVTTPSGRTYSYLRDANGNPTALTTPEGGVHQLGYDANNEPASYQPPASSGWAWDLDGLRRREGVSYPDGTTRDDLYADDRFVGSSLPEGTIDLAYAETSSGTGLTSNVESLSRTPSGASSQMLDLDLDGSLLTGLSMSGPGSATVSWDHAVPYQPASRTLNTEAPIGFAYDDDGLLTGVGPFTVSRSPATGLPTTIGDGTLEVSFDFDGRGQLLSRRVQVAGADAYSLDLGHDQSGRIATRAEIVDGASTARTYAYDADGQLVRVEDGGGAVIESFLYDSNGNRTSAAGGSQTYDAADRVVSRGGLSYSYDANGFLAGRGADGFNYTADGTLASATVGGVSVSYGYDAFGRRVTRTTGAGTTTYVYGDTDQPFRVSGSIGADGTVSEYIYDDAGALFALRRAGSWYYVAADQAGSPRVVIDAVSGAVLKTVDYSAFGEVLADSDPAFELPVGFAGGLPDPDTDLVRFGLRDYEPASGRWTGSDPILYAGTSLNLYEYVGNDPVNRIDPAGLFSIGGSLYVGFGAGIELTITPEGFGICTEGGVGAGEGFGLNPLANQLPDDGTSAVFETGLGPVSGGLEVPFDDCWSSGRGLNVKPYFNPFVLDVTPGSNNALPVDAAKAKPKLSLQAKLAIKGCGSLRW